MNSNLPELLEQLRLKMFAEHYQSLAEQGERSNWSHVDYLSELAERESEHRGRQRIERLLKDAKLPTDKLLSDFDFAEVPNLSKSKVQDLATGDFIDRYENILIFGNPGTGKTHLSIALAREWCLAGRKVRFIRAAELVQLLLKAKQDLRLNEFIAKWDKYEVILIDDISYVPFERHETDVLFNLLSARYETRSIVITSNLGFSHWNSIFKDDMTTVAAVDRLVHHASILELNTKSYRAKTREAAESKAMQSIEQPDEQTEEAATT